MRKCKSQFAERLCVTTERDRAIKKTEVQALARAVRPAALAASAWHSLFVAASAEAHAVPQVTGFKKTGLRFSGIGIQVWQEQMQALRRSARPNTTGRAATSFARGAGSGLLASAATQRTMRAGRVPSGARSNPSIERTCPGKPGQASHLKR